MKLCFDFDVADGFSWGISVETAAYDGLELKRKNSLMTRSRDNTTYVTCSTHF